MLRHIVFFKYKTETPPERRQNFLHMLRALPERVPGIASAEVGEDVMHMQRSFDVAIVFTFADRAALEVYSAHPEHVTLVEESRRINEKVCSVDFEVK
ncbi:MAG: Dabb family protein [Acidobacteriia bacterium]|nr:Dabb family protein [Terriglobia bacterium]